MDGFEVDYFCYIYNKQPFGNSNYIRIMLIVKGDLRVEIDYKPVNLNLHQLLIVPRTLQLTSCGQAYLEAFCLSFSYEYYTTIGINYLQNFLNQYFKGNTYTKLILSKHTSGHLKDFLSYLQGKNKCRANKYIVNEISLLSFHLLLLEITNCLCEVGRPPKNLFDKSRQIAFDFLKLLHKNITKEKNVKFYADKLHITPVYLSRILKETMAKTAKEFIQNALLQNAKFLLLNSDLTVKELAYKLGFSADYTFIKFFKRHTGITPFRYRKRALKKKEQEKEINLKP